MNNAGHVPLNVSAISNPQVEFTWSPASKKVHHGVPSISRTLLGVKERGLELPPKLSG